MCACVCVYLRERPGNNNSYFCPVNWFYLFLSMHCTSICIHHIQYSQYCTVVQKTICSEGKSSWKHHSALISVAIFLCRLGFCTISSSQESLQRCHCILDYFCRDHLGKKVTFIIIKQWHDSVITSDILSLLAQHIVILWQEYNVAHSECGWLFNSTANENNPAASCV